MPYVINNRNGDEIVIADGEINNDFSLELVGRNAENYGLYFAENFIDLLDNFASAATPPAKAVDGQNWYDKTYKVLRSHDSALGNWKPLAPIFTDTASPANDHGQNTEGTFYFNRDIGQLFLYDGTAGGYLRTNIPGEMTNDYTAEGNISSPSVYGTRIRNIYLVDANGDHRSVLALVSTNDSLTSSTRLTGEKFIGLFSEHASFTVADVDHRSEGVDANHYDQLVESGGIGDTIVPGLNLRTDNETSVEGANIAERANAAFNLNTGSYGADGANITASNVFHAGANSTPDTNATYDHGASGFAFNSSFTQDLYLGDGATGTIQAEGNSVVSVGTAINPIDDGYFTNLSVTSSVDFASGLDLGNASNYLGNIFVDALTANSVTVANYTLPTGNPGNGYVLYASGTSAPFSMFWDVPASNVADVTGGAGLQVSYPSTPNLGANAEVARRVVEVYVGAGTGITVNSDNVAVDLSVFTSDDLPEGATNKYATSASVRASISVDDTGGDGALNYSNANGVISYVGPSASETRAHFSNTTGISYSAASGEIGVADDFFTSFAGNIRAEIGNVLPILYNAASGIISLDSSNVDAGSIGGVGPGDFLRINQNDTTDANIISAWGDGSTVKIIDTGGANLELSSGEIAYLTGDLVHTGASGNVTFTSTGGVTATGSIQQLSDQSVKGEEEIIADALAKVHKLRGLTYVRTDRNDGIRHTGLIAQDVQKVLPEAVEMHPDGKLSVGYGELAGLLVEAIKELSNEVTDLKAVIAELNKGDS